MIGWNKVLKGRSHYVFNYKPRYYDERKERIDKLREKYTDNKENVDFSDDVSPIVFSKNELRKSWSKTKTKPSDNNYTLRLAIIITIIAGIACYILDFHHLI